MKTTIKQTKADWKIKLKVTDRSAKTKGQKYLVYEFNGDVRTDDLDKQLTNAVIEMQHYGKKWKEQ